MNQQTPLISCICITNNEHGLLQRALDCFERQDYSHKELVISYRDDDLLTKDIIDRLDEVSMEKIIRIERPRQEKLEIAKNNAINTANGAFICIWNEKDWHHANRLSYQYKVIKDGPFKASILTYIFLHDWTNEQTFYSSYYEWKETLLCEKQIMLSACYMNKERGENISTLRFLSSRNALFRILEAPHLYTHITYLNKNGIGRFNSHFLKGEQLEENINQIVRELIDPNNSLYRNI